MGTGALPSNIQEHDMTKLRTIALAAAALATTGVATTAQAGYYIPFCYWRWVWTPWGYVYQYYCF
jgi:hypothetical protein